MHRNVIYSMYGLLVIFVCLLVLSGVFLWPKLSALDPVNKSSALVALSQSPMIHATGVQWFTGGTLEQTVSGTDSVGRKMYVIEQNGQLVSTIYAHAIVSRAHAEGVCTKLAAPYGGIVSSAVLGYWNGQQATAATVTEPLVWEVVLHLRSGEFSYYFVSAYTLKILWHFTSTDTFRLWDQ